MEIIHSHISTIAFILIAIDKNIANLQGKNGGEGGTIPERRERKRALQSIGLCCIFSALARLLASLNLFLPLLSSI